MEEVPDDYDILYLGYKDLLTCKVPEDCSFNYIYKPYFSLLTHAMIISNKGLKKLLNLITKIDYHIDWLIAYNNKKLNIYASQNKIVNQIWLESYNSNLKTTFPKIINYYLDNVNDCNDIPISYNINFQLYKYKDYIITRMTYIIFNLGVLANIHDSILLLCLLYFACDYDRFYLIVFLLGYFIGNIFKYIMHYYKVNHYTIFCLFILLIVFLNVINFPFILIKTLF